ncbi:B12-binding domain-containing radical SAM protein [Candidatus Bathyarchaeota archaeon A05DMB-2]|nr:B12-binding domain-containing radical SAM protein [Candidatus Bathyarchaeota archaeon A05DMB-2]
MTADRNIDVLLTADRTLMSNYHGNEFLGFGTCAPPNFIPNILYSYLFFPPLKTKNGVPVAAPYGLRKIEAQLLKGGFNVLTVSPQHLRKHIKNAKVVGIHTMDPFGFGPASTTLASAFKKEPFLAKYFHALVNSPVMREAKKRGLKVIVGGPGAWQFRYRPQLLKEGVIDCVVEGEAENVIGKIVKAAINGEMLPTFYEVAAKDAPCSEDIPDIVQPSINGLIEIGRGCCRGCEFCNVTLRPLRWYPLDKIMRELLVNVELGKNRVICLHAEDVMLYGSHTTVPDDEKLLRLHKSVKSKVPAVSWSHCSLAAAASKPKLFSELSEIILQNQSWWGAEVGIETGSAELAKRIMPAKAHPFKAEDWPEVVRDGMGLMHDNMMVPACTLIVGLPEEKEEDILRTMELMDDLEGFRSLIVPLFFVPLGRLKNEDWFKDAAMTELHKQLLFQCAEHSLRWTDNLIDLSFVDEGYKRILKEFYKAFAGIAKRQIRQAEITMLQ